MKLVVQKITPPSHPGYETPLYLVSPFDPEREEDVVQGRHHLTMNNIFNIAGEYHILTRDYPAVLIDLKDDATGEKHSRITLVFDPEVAKELYVQR